MTVVDAALLTRGAPRPPGDLPQTEAPTQLGRRCRRSHRGHRGRHLPRLTTLAGTLGPQPPVPPPAWPPGGGPGGHQPVASRHSPRRRPRLHRRHPLRTPVLRRPEDPAPHATAPLHRHRHETSATPHGEPFESMGAEQRGEGAPVFRTGDVVKGLAGPGKGRVAEMPSLVYSSPVRVTGSREVKGCITKRISS